MSNIPKAPGLWYRTKEQRYHDRVVRVCENVRGFEGIEFPLAWYAGEGWNEGWVPVRDDGRWVREVRPDDVSAVEADDLRKQVATLRAERDAAIERAAIAEEDCDYAESTVTHLRDSAQDAKRVLALALGREPAASSDENEWPNLLEAVRMLRLRLFVEDTITTCNNIKEES